MKHLSKDCYPQLVLNPHRSKNLASKGAGLQVHITTPEHTFMEIFDAIIPDVAPNNGALRSDTITTGK